MWAVELQLASGNFENVWGLDDKDADECPQLFETAQAALDELHDHAECINEAHTECDVIARFDPSEWRIRNLETNEIFHVYQAPLPCLWGALTLVPGESCIEQ